MREIIWSGFKVGVATLAGILGWIVAGKVLALQLGAAGLGLFGLLRQLLQGLTILGSLNGQTALVRGIASQDDPQEQGRFGGNVLIVQMGICTIFAITLYAISGWLAPRMIPHPNAIPLFRMLMVAMLISAYQSYLTGIMNGYRLINELLKSQLIGPITVILSIYPMVWMIRKGFPFGYILMLLVPALAISISGTVSLKCVKKFPTVWPLTIDSNHWKPFLKASSILLLAGLVTTSAQYSQTWMIAKKMGFTDVGYYWAAWTLSMSYVTLVLGSLGTYYMPSLSCLHTNGERIELIRKYLRTTLLVMPILVGILVIVKPYIIKLMFSNSLLPSLKVMRWMFLGDYLKGISWVLGFPILAFGEVGLFLVVESAFSGLLILGTWIWIVNGGGIEGLGALYFFQYFVYLIAISIIILKRHRFKWLRSEVAVLFSGFSLLLFLSWASWNATKVSPWQIGFIVLASTAHLLICRWTGVLENGEFSILVTIKRFRTGAQ